MERRAFLGTLVGTLLTGPLTAAAQPVGKVYRIGHLAASSPSAENTRLLSAFQTELRGRGWVEGRNVAFEYRWAEGRYERLPALAAELTDAKVDLIVAGGTPNALAAQGATRVIPIVMVGATTPVELGLVNSLARPGGNVTGVTFDVSPEQTAKLVELLAEVPGVSRIALERAAAARQRTIRFVEVLKPEDFVRFATEMRVVTVFGGRARRLVVAGGLISWSADSGASWGQAAVYADKILRGALPATCRSSSRPRSSWWSTSRPPGRSASPFHRRSCCGRTR
jgi:putative tryptophan/tyrosine transport system substrate-binding protein